MWLAPIHGARQNATKPRDVRLQKVRQQIEGNVKETATQNPDKPVNSWIFERNEKTPSGHDFEYGVRMGRPHRPNIPGATYHVMNRGNRKGIIYQDARDRRQFRRILIEEQEVHEVKVLGGTEMDTHFHLAVVTPHGNLSEFMQQLQGRYARFFNWRHQRVGHVFQGRFRHVYIEGDVQLLTALCYIFMNPVAAGMVSRPEDYAWSTYAATIGLQPHPPYLYLDWLEAQFPHLTLAEAKARLRQLMSEPKPVAAYLQEMELHVDPDTIKQVIRAYTGEQFQLASFPGVYRRALRPSLEDLLRDSHHNHRRLITDARVLYGYRNSEIARALGMMPATVSKIFCDERRRGHQSVNLFPAA